jgi:hypothetical protein
MKKIFNSLVFLFLSSAGFAQTIPGDSLYLGQNVPGNNPELFKLQVSPAHFAAERITISNSGKEIYYSEIKSYYPIQSARIKYYKYEAGKWTGPFVLFEDYCSPALLVTGDKMYFENENAETFLSIQKKSKWSVPKKILFKLERAHYLKVTDKRNSYVSSIPKETIGKADWCRLKYSESDTLAVGLGMPLNTAWDNLDFFIAKDESFIIVTTISGLAISYPKSDGSWTSPRNLGEKINFGLASWGPYVTTDKKYLFYTTGTKPDYSDVGIYWIRIDNLIDSLKNTNSTPYMKNKIENQSGLVGTPFSFAIPGKAFFDEDGNTTFTYSAILNTGQSLPAWLSLDKETGRFSGIPVETGEYTIICIAADNENAQGFGVFKLTIKEKP